MSGTRSINFWRGWFSIARQCSGFSFETEIADIRKEFGEEAEKYIRANKDKILED
jgi:hypothetical protein